MSTLRVGDVELGSGVPKVIVPVGAPSTDGLVARARTVVAAGPDLVEWRVDHLARLDVGSVLAAGRALRGELGGLPLLTTVRTAAEGGRADLHEADHVALCRELLDAGLADLLDVEAMLPGPAVHELVGLAHAVGVPVVASNHDMTGTPSAAEIGRRLSLMRDLGADVLKIAVMPHDAGDVLALLEATWQARLLGRPLVTVAMGGLGAVTRIAGGVFGSAATFAKVAEPSAPGQLEVAQVREAMALVHGRAAG